MIPDPVDDNNDPVIVTINFYDLDEFAQWDLSNREIYLFLPLDIEPKLYEVDVILDDAQKSTIYTLSINVLSVP